MFDSRRDLLALVGAGIFSSGFALRTHGEVEMPNDQITPFTVAISDAQIADLKERLTMARWPTQIATDWSHGQPVAFIRELAEQWLKDFDWRAHEAALNAYPQFTTVIDGQTIHFLHIKSPEPNAFTNPPADEGNLAIGYAAADNVYRSARWQLEPDQALVIRGRFPRCRFANIVLFNNHMQTLSYDRRQVSLNRVQTVHEPDGSFRMVLSHRDPGVPNWLDTRGLPHGTMFWRFLLPEEPVPELTTELVSFDEVAR